MNRSQFLKLGVAASVAVVAGSSGASVMSPSGPLGRWLSQYRGSTLEKGKTFVMVARLRVNELEPALRELDALTEGSMRCSGSNLQGKVGGRPFEMKIQLG